MLSQKIGLAKATDKNIIEEIQTIVQLGDFKKEYFLTQSPSVPYGTEGLIHAFSAPIQKLPHTSKVPL